MPRTKKACTTFYPPPELDARVRELATLELRSKATMIVVLLTEALEARQVTTKRRQKLLGENA